LRRGRGGERRSTFFLKKEKGKLKQKGRHSQAGETQTSGVRKLGYGQVQSGEKERELRGGKTEKGTDQRSTVRRGPQCRFTKKRRFWTGRVNTAKVVQIHSFPVTQEEKWKKSGQKSSKLKRIKKGPKGI